MKAETLLKQLADSGTGEGKIRQVREMVSANDDASMVIHAFAALGHMGTVEKACKIAGLRVTGRQEMQSPIIIGPAPVAKGNDTPGEPKG